MYICSWNQLRDLVDQKREDINLAHGLQNFHIECNETIVSQTQDCIHYSN